MRSEYGLVWMVGTFRHFRYSVFGAQDLIVCLDGNIYSGTEDNMIEVWSGMDGRHLQTLSFDHGEWCIAAQTLFGQTTRYTVAKQKRYKCCQTCVEGTPPVMTLGGPTCKGYVAALAIGQDAKIYSRFGKTIRVWG